MIIFNHLNIKLLGYLLHSNWEYIHGASICLNIILTDIIINGCMESNCDNICVEASFICLMVLSSDDLFQFQSDILVASIRALIINLLWTLY